MVMAKEDCESHPRIADEESPTNTLFSSRNRCFNLPCFGPRQTAPAPSSRSGSLSSTKSSLWERLRFAEGERRWWSRPFKALKKIREWSEIVAGPKWKTFIRRFNRNRSGGCGGGGGGGGGGGAHKHGNFQYDPLSYALNFDEGPTHAGKFDEDYGYYPDFTSRYVSGTLSSKTSMDLGRGVPAAG